MHMDTAETGIGVMFVMNREGDTKISWDRRNAEEVKHAEESFGGFKAKGFAAFSLKDVGTKEEKGELMQKFDPLAERVVFVPPLKGGR